MNDKPLVCAFTGHRPRSLPWGSNEGDERCLALKYKLEVAIAGLLEEKNKITEFISGMAMGTDLICAEIVLRLKAERGGIILSCALPCLTQTRRWPEAQKRRRSGILERADKIYLVNADFSPGCMWQRNKYMVDRADAVIAVLSKPVGGTANTVNYAIETGKKVIVINPEV